MRIAPHRDAAPSALSGPRAARLSTIVEEDEEPPSPTGGGALRRPSYCAPLRTARLPLDANRSCAATRERRPARLQAAAPGPDPGRLG